MGYFLYDNEYASFIDIYFYDYFHLALALQTFLDTLSNVLDKCLCFSVIKIEPVSSLVPSSPSVVYTFLLKMLSLVLIRN